MHNLVYHGDCLEASKEIESGSVDLILTDLPYGILSGLKAAPTNPDNINKYETGGGYYKDYSWDSQITPFYIHNIANSILRKNGKMILFGQEPYTSELITEAIPNVPFSYRMVWEKDNFANCLLAKKAPVSYYEDILVFSKTHDQEGLHPLREYFKEVMKYIGGTKKSIIEKIGQKADHTFRVNSTQYLLCTAQTYQELIEKFGIDKMEGFKEFEELEKINSVFNSVFNLREGKKYKSNILKYKKDYDGYHPTQKPILLLEDLIKTYSNEGDLVVDLTAGSGSTGVACKNTKRGYILIEKEKKYIDIIHKRLLESKQ